MSTRESTGAGKARAMRWLAVAGLTATQGMALAEAPDPCRSLVGTYVVTVTDIEGVFASRGLATFTGDGIFLMTDSGQTGLPGIYQPFSSAQGAWTCLGAQGDQVKAAATGLNFVLPGEGLSTSFGRTDYRLRLDLKSATLSGSVELSFTQEGDLEAADPIARPGPVFETFEIEGRRLTPTDGPSG